MTKESIQTTLRWTTRLDEIVEKHLKKFSEPASRELALGYGVSGRGFYILMNAQALELSHRASDDAQRARKIEEHLRIAVTEYGKLSFYSRIRLEAAAKKFFPQTLFETHGIEENPHAKNLFAVIARALPEINEVVGRIEQAKKYPKIEMRALLAMRACAVIWEAREAGKPPKFVSGVTTLDSRGPFASFVEEVFQELNITTTVRAAVDAFHREKGTVSEAEQHEINQALSFGLSAAFAQLTRKSQT